MLYINTVVNKWNFLQFRSETRDGGWRMIAMRTECKVSARSRFVKPRAAAPSPSQVDESVEEKRRLADTDRRKRDGIIYKGEREARRAYFVRDRRKRVKRYMEVAGAKKRRVKAPGEVTHRPLPPSLPRTPWLSAAGGGTLCNEHRRGAQPLTGW